MIQWPDVFPHVSREGYNLERVNNLLTTQMQSGLSRTRSRFETVPTMVTASFVATSAQGTAFEAWYMAALKGGAEWFELPLVEPQTDRATQTAKYRVQFVERYKGPDMFGAGLWRYSMKLVALPMPEVADPDYGNWPEYIIDASIFDVAMNKHWPEAL